MISYMFFLLGLAVGIVATVVYYDAKRSRSFQSKSKSKEPLR